MLIDAAYYYEDIFSGNTDKVPSGHHYFVLGAGYSQAITLPSVDTIHLNRRDYQLIYVLGGPLHYYDEDGTEHLAQPGNFLLYKPFEYQHYTIFKEEGTSFLWCHFGGDLVDEFLKEYHLLNKRIITTNENPTFRKLFYLMRNNLTQKQPYYIEICKLYLQELITSIARANKLKNTQKEYPENLTTALEYIHYHYHEKIKISQLTRICATNHKALSKLFVEYLGVAPSKYLTNLRIQKAKILLLQTNHQINAIALAVGFSDPLYFSNVFHKATGLSPREFRNKNK